MKKFGLSLIAVALLLTSASVTNCYANKGMVTKKLDVVEFSSIEVKGHIDVEYIQTSKSTSATLIAPEEVMQYITVTTTNNKLAISCDTSEKARKIMRNKKILLLAASPNMTGVSVKGAGDLKFMEDVKGDNLNIVISGAGDFTFNNLEYNTINVSVSGAGDILAKSSILCDKFVANISGSGDVEINKIGCKELFQIKISGAGDIDVEEVFAEQTILEISGAGGIKIAGVGIKAKFMLSGAGTINAQNFKVEEVEAKASGAANISCYPIEKLDATASGAATIKYRGEPKIINTKSKNVTKL